MTTQPEIPDEVRKHARELVRYLDAMPSEGNIDIATRYLLVERNRTIEECAGIAEGIQPSMTTTAGIVFAGAIATEIRALLK